VEGGGLGSWRPGWVSRTKGGKNSTSALKSDQQKKIGGRADLEWHEGRERGWGKGSRGIGREGIGVRRRAKSEQRNV